MTFGLVVSCLGVFQLYSSLLYARKIDAKIILHSFSELRLIVEELSRFLFRDTGPTGDPVRFLVQQIVAADGLGITRLLCFGFWIIGGLEFPSSKSGSARDLI